MADFYSPFSPDQEIIDGLKTGDEVQTRRFFYELCNYSLIDVQLSLFRGEIGYDELVNELYLYLSDENWRKLNTFSGRNNCSLRSWMATLIWRFFIQKRFFLSGRPASQTEKHALESVHDIVDVKVEIALDLEMTFNRMPNKRYVEVLRLLLVDGYTPEEVAVRLGTKPSNVYNIKHRAIVQFIQIYSE